MQAWCYADTVAYMREKRDGLVFDTRMLPGMCVTGFRHVLIISGVSQPGSAAVCCRC